MPERALAKDMGKALEQIATVPRLAVHGRVSRIIGPVVEASPLHVAIGDLCSVSTGTNGSIMAEVVGFHERGVLLMPLGQPDGIFPGATVRPLGKSLEVPVADALQGRILDGLGQPLDGRGPLSFSERRPLTSGPPNPLERARITEPLGTGIRAIDGLLTIGRGQRMGIFAGSGVGKSVLLGMIARGTGSCGLSRLNRRGHGILR